MRHSFSPFLLLIFISFISIQSQTKQEVLLRYQYVPGEILKYKEITQIQQQGKYIRDVFLTTEELTSYRTEKVNSDSSADIILVIEKTESHLFKEKIPSGRQILIDVPILQRQSANGKILDMQPVEDESSKKRKMIEQLKIQNQMAQGFPEHPLKLGEKWVNNSSSSYDFNERRIELNFNISLQFLGFDTYQGVKCVVISRNMEINGTSSDRFEEVPVKGSGKGQILFDPVHGQILQQWTQFESRATITVAKGTMELITEVVTNSELVK